MAVGVIYAGVCFVYVVVGFILAGLRERFEGPLNEDQPRVMLLEQDEQRDALFWAIVFLWLPFGLILVCALPLIIPCALLYHAHEPIENLRQKIRGYE